MDGVFNGNSDEDDDRNNVGKSNSVFNGNSDGNAHGVEHGE